MFAKVDKKGLTEGHRNKKKFFRAFSYASKKIIFVKLQLIEIESNRKVALITVIYVGNRKSHVPILIRMYSWIHKIFADSCEL